MKSKLHLTIFFIAATVFFTSCVFFDKKNDSTRTIQNIASAVENFNQGPIEWIDTITQKVKASKSIEQTCSEILLPESDMLSQLDFESLNIQQVKKYGVEWLRKAFLLKKEINARLPDMSKECRQGLVSFFRHLRQAEDYIGELAYNVKDRNAFDIDFKKVQAPVINKKAYSPYQTTPEYDTQNGFQFENGDVVITRGISFISATIGQTTEDQTHYSHGVFFHKDKTTGKVQSIESYLQQGVELYSLEDALKNENARLMLFRAWDRDLANRASDLMYDKVKGLKARGQRIPYDYDINLVDHSKMTCGEIIVASFEWASDGKFIIPESPSKIRLKNPYVLKKLNLNGETTFSPGNLEIDPRFELILEWRDYTLVRDQRQKDMIVKKIFDWMENDGYVLQGSFTTFALKFIWSLRNTVFWNVVSRPLDLTKVPEDTPQGFLVTVAQLRNVGAALLKEVKLADQAYQKKNGYPMSEKRLLEFLEKFRIEDKEKFLSNKASQLHRLLRPALTPQEGTID